MLYFFEQMLINSKKMRQGIRKYQVYIIISLLVWVIVWLWVQLKIYDVQLKESSNIMSKFTSKFVQAFIQLLTCYGWENRKSAHINLHLSVN